jgi:hypothetical protein
MAQIKEPPCTERFARWCERTGNKIGGKLFYFPPTRLFSDPDFSPYSALAGFGCAILVTAEAKSKGL